jgi:hypothetical protein
VVTPRRSSPPSPIEVRRRWRLEASTEAAELLAGELMADAAVRANATGTPIELRMERRATGLLIAVQAGGTWIRWSVLRHPSRPPGSSPDLGDADGPGGARS